jgi:hypothetical protein
MLLVEKSRAARTACFASAHFDGEALPGALVRARITGSTATHLIAVPAA